MEKFNNKGKIEPLLVILGAIILVQAAIIFALSIDKRRLKLERLHERIELQEEQISILPSRKEPGPKVAIVLDDWGYGTGNLALLDKIDVPLTLAILPSQRYSQSIAGYANKRGWQTMLHLPLEPESIQDYARLEPDTILTSMKNDEIMEILNRNLDSLPGIVGVSNHMGSKATASGKLMKMIFDRLAKDELFFLDSLVIPNSVCKKIAKKSRIGLISRDIFLDNIQEYEYIANQLDKLIQLAKEKGKALGVGHDRELTLIVLRDKLPQLSSGKEEIEFVFVSDLVE